MCLYMCVYKSSYCPCVCVCVLVCNASGERQSDTDFTESTVFELAELSCELN